MLSILVYLIIFAQFEIYEEKIKNSLNNIPSLQIVGQMPIHQIILQKGRLKYLQRQPKSIRYY